MTKSTDNIVQVDPMLLNYTERFKRYAEEGKDRAKHPAKVVQLPLWNLNERAAPNALLRSAVFGVVGKGRRQVFKKSTQLATVGDVVIMGLGIQLDQADLDVWQMALNLANDQPLGTTLEFSSRVFLKAIHRQQGKSDRDWLKESLKRLQSFSIEVKADNYAYVGSLVHDFEVDEHTGRYRINLNPKLRALFDAGWTQIDFETRLKLKGKPLAQWLAGFYATHVKPYPYKISTLHRLSGSTAELKDFKRSLTSALDQCYTSMAIDHYEIKDDSVHVKRFEGNNAQERYKAKQARLSKSSGLKKMGK